MRFNATLLALAVICGACAGGSGEDSSAPATTLDLATAKIVDLSYTYDDNTLYWPTSPSAFELESLHYGPTEAGFFYSANVFSTPEHGGTHLDAPIHFAEGAWTTDQIPLDRLIGPAAVIDVSSQAAADPDYLLAADDVTAWESEHGTIASGSIVLLHTGWGKRWPSRLDYLGDDTPGDASDLHFPGYGEDAAQLLVKDRQIAVLGIDTASIDHGPSRYFLVHQAAAAANVAALENVANLDQLPPIGAWVFALPIKIGSGSGGPVRIAALVP